MRKYNIFNIGAYLFGILFLVTVSMVFSGLTALAAGATYAVGAVVPDGPVTTTNVKAGSPDLDKNYISKKVTEMRPSATPLDTIMRSITNGVDIKSFVSDYYAVDSRPITDTVHEAYTHAGDGNTTTDLAVHLVLPELTAKTWPASLYQRVLAMAQLKYSLLMDLLAVA